MKLFLALLAALLVGCSPSKETPAPSLDISITSVELRQLMTDTNKVLSVSDPIITDTIYRVPKEEWIAEKLDPAVKDFLFKYNLRTFHEERNDCDNYVLYAKAVANILNNTEAGTDRSIAVGEFGGMGGVFGLAVHDVLAIAVQTKDGKIKIVLYDPMYGDVVDLDKANVACLFWRF